MKHWPPLAIRLSCSSTFSDLTDSDVGISKFLGNVAQGDAELSLSSPACFAA